MRDMRGSQRASLPSLGNTLANMAKYRRQWENRLALARHAMSTRGHLPEPGSSRLTEVHGFGSNPGRLRMFKYVPAQPERALVVVLHGCTQNAAVYDFGAGWSTLADRYGFVLLMPQQEPSNNPNKCFNWFLSRHIERDKGETLSIRQMVEAMIRDHYIDPRSVYVTGLSAGGAMTVVLLATYPELFAGGAVIAGLPYRTATNMNEAFESMFNARPRPAHEWGNLVRAASRHDGPWPRISVWHGDSDPLVKRENADHLCVQWANVHGLEEAPTGMEIVDGYPRQVWRNQRGEDVIESYTIPRMAHGTPLAAGDSHDRCGKPGAFLLDVGISSSYHIAKFWGLADRGRAIQRSKLPRPQPVAPREMAEARTPEPARHTQLPAVIEKALRSAGLWKLP
jgi:poly(hydroxyalkanoate) depolymerase family esterase